MRTIVNGLVQAASCKAEGKYYGGKKVYFFNETVHTKIIEIK